MLIDSSSSDLVEKWFIKSVRSQNEIRLFIANTTHCENHFISIDRCFLSDPRFLPKYMICARISSFQAMGISVKEWVPFQAMITVSVTYLMNFAEEPPHLSSKSGEETIIAQTFSESLLLRTEGVQGLNTTPYKLLFQAPFWILKTWGNNVTCSMVWQGDYCAWQLTREGCRTARLQPMGEEKHCIYWGCSLWRP